MLSVSVLITFMKESLGKNYAITKTDLKGMCVYTKLCYFYKSQLSKTFKINFKIQVQNCLITIAVYYTGWPAFSYT